MKYAILKNLAGTYCNTLHITSNDFELITKMCEDLNKENKHGIIYHVRELSDFETK